MPDFRQRLILFKPMRPGVSGYARLQSERGALLAQLNARGLEAESVQAYWYGAGGEARLMGATRVNAHGEASLTAELPGDALAPERLQAVLLLSGGAEPVPLMIGLCVQQSAGSLLDAKNAALALCERLARMQQAVDTLTGELDGRLLAEEVIRTEERNRILHFCMDEMNPDYREVLYLTYFEDMSYAQAAEVTGKTVKQITNMVYRGKESLRRLLEREGITNAES